MLLLYCMAQGWVGKCMHEQRLGHVNPVFITLAPSSISTKAEAVFRARASLGSPWLSHIAPRYLCMALGMRVTREANGTGGHAQQCGHYWDCKRQQSTYFAGKQGYHDWNAQWAVLSGWIERIAANASLKGALAFVDGTRQIG